LAIEDKKQDQREKTNRVLKYPFLSKSRHSGCKPQFNLNLTIVDYIGESEVACYRTLISSIFMKVQVTGMNLISPINSSPIALAKNIDKNRIQYIG